MSCPHCSTEAENLLELADALLQPRSTLAILDGWPPDALAAAVLGVQLRLAKPSIVFRALVEGWDRKRLIQELN